ncbi:MAG: hypothetical protein ACREBC_25380 [Pyrinomonadaceae bacterium]
MPEQVIILALDAIGRDIEFYGYGKLGSRDELIGVLTRALAKLVAIS